MNTMLLVEPFTVDGNVKSVTRIGGKLWMIARNEDGGWYCDRMIDDFEFDRIKRESSAYKPDEVKNDVDIKERQHGRNYIKEFIDDNNLQDEVHFKLNVANNEVYSFKLLGEHYVLKNMNGNTSNDVLLRLLSGEIEVSPLTHIKPGERFYLDKTTGYIIKGKDCIYMVEKTGEILSEEKILKIIRNK